ncbi:MULTISPECIES: SWIM zinc finger family protein, partial [unclassified Colwellia]|uniref:SWIM zinc finger family protein n=1 Tax=unclassified Colwellia TaxID=196834 RepID=UPI001C714B9D
LVFVEQVKILKRVQDDGVVFRMTESGLFIIRIYSFPCRHAELVSVSRPYSLPCRHAEFISVSGFYSFPCRHAELVSVSGLCRASIDPETSSG